MKNEQLVKLVSDMRKLSIEKKVDFWKKIAQELEKPTRRKREVNLSKIPSVVNKGETAVIPGKLLGKGKVDFEIAAYQASESSKAGNKVISLDELMKKNPTAKNCRIIC